jgi:hypothetical protein
MADDVAHLARAALVGALRETGALRSEPVTRAFAAVPRHRLLEEFLAVPRHERRWEGPSGPGSAHRSVRRRRHHRASPTSTTRSSPACATGA